MISPPMVSLFLFGLASLLAVVAFAPNGLIQQILERAVSLLVARFGEPVSHPPAEVMRRFHRGETLVVISVAARAHVHAPKPLEALPC